MPGLKKMNFIEGYNKIYFVKLNYSWPIDKNTSVQLMHKGIFLESKYYLKKLSGYFTVITSIFWFTIP